MEQAELQSVVWSLADWLETRGVLGAALHRLSASANQDSSDWSPLRIPLDLLPLADALPGLAERLSQHLADCEAGLFHALCQHGAIPPSGVRVWLDVLNAPPCPFISSLPSAFAGRQYPGGQLCQVHGTVQAMSSISTTVYSRVLLCPACSTETVSLAGQPVPGCSRCHATWALTDWKERASGRVLIPSRTIWLGEPHSAVPGAMPAGLQPSLLPVTLLDDLASHPAVHMGAAVSAVGPITVVPAAPNSLSGTGFATSKTGVPWSLGRPTTTTLSMRACSVTPACLAWPWFSFDVAAESQASAEKAASGHHLQSTTELQTQGQRPSHHDDPMDIDCLPGERGVAPHRSTLHLAALSPFLCSAPHTAGAAQPQEQLPGPTTCNPAHNMVCALMDGLGCYVDPTLALSLLTSAAMAGCGMQHLQAAPPAFDSDLNHQQSPGRAPGGAQAISAHPHQMLRTLFPGISGLDAVSSTDSGSGPRRVGGIAPALPTASGISFLDSSQQPGSPTGLPWATSGMHDSLLSLSPGRRGRHQHPRLPHDEFYTDPEGTPGIGGPHASTATHSSSGSSASKARPGSVHVSVHGGIGDPLPLRILQGSAALLCPLSVSATSAAPNGVPLVVPEVEKAGWAQVDAAAGGKELVVRSSRITAANAGVLVVDGAALTGQGVAGAKARAQQLGAALISPAVPLPASALATSGPHAAHLSGSVPITATVWAVGPAGAGSSGAGGGAPGSGGGGTGGAHHWPGSRFSLVLPLGASEGHEALCALQAGCDLGSPDEAEHVARQVGALRHHMALVSQLPPSPRLTAEAKELLTAYFLSLRSAGPAAAALAKDVLKHAVSVAGGYARLMLRSTILPTPDCTAAIVLLETSLLYRLGMEQHVNLDLGPPLSMDPSASLDTMLSEIHPHLVQQLAGFKPSLVAAGGAGGGEEAQECDQPWAGGDDDEQDE